MPPSLEELVLDGGQALYQHHKFTGGIPSEWGSLTNLKKLSMARCGLDGAIPASIGDLSSLQTLVLADNALTGPIPESIGGLTNLQKLELWQNKLTGPSLPETFKLLTPLASTLKVLCLGENPLGGTIT